MVQLTAEHADLEGLQPPHPLKEDGDHHRHPAADENGPHRLHMKERERQQDHRRNHRPPGQVEGLLQGVEDGGIHLPDGKENGQDAVEDQGQGQGQRSGPPHPPLHGVLVRPGQGRRQGRRGGGRAQPLPQVGPGDHRPRRHGQIRPAGAGDDRQDHPRRPRHPEGAAEGEGHDSGHEKGRQKKNVGGDQLQTVVDEKGDGAAGPPQPGEAADEHQHPQHHHGGAGPVPRHGGQRPPTVPPPAGRQGEAHQAEGQPDGQGPAHGHTQKNAAQKYGRCNQHIHIRSLLSDRAARPPPGGNNHSTENFTIRPISLMI